MTIATSADGTRIAYRRVGEGPPVVLVSGALDDGAETAPLADALATRFTAVDYARRGRGDSDDGGPYAVAREIEDIAAIIADIAVPIHLVGMSSGGALALDAAAVGLPVRRVAVWEVPYQVDAASRRQWMDYVDELTVALADERCDDALTAFMRLAGSSAEDIDAARNSPYWPALLRLAPTLAHDAAVLGDGAAPVDRLARIAQPVLVATGGGDPHTAGVGAGFFDAAADMITDAIPDTRRIVLEGQTHIPDPSVFAAELTAFFSGRGEG